MMLLLGFLPFGVFALGDRLFSTFPALVLAACTAAALAARDLLSHKGLKLLDTGAALLFGGLAAYTALSHASWTVLGVRLWTDAGLLLLVVLSIAIGRPFTLAYAKERVPAHVWTKPEFVRTNVRISSAWAAAFAAIVLADAAMLAGLPIALGVLATLAALGGALLYTTRIVRKGHASAPF